MLSNSVIPFWYLVIKKTLNRTPYEPYKPYKP